MRPCLYLPAIAAMLMFCPGHALAHAAEQGFVLLLPTQAYAFGGTMTVAATIVLVTCLPVDILHRLFRPVARMPRLPLRRAADGVSVLATCAFLCLVWIGWAGPPDPQENLLPLTLWTVWWIALFMVQGLVMDIWRWVNPWRGLLTLIGRDAPLLSLPERWQAWPAVVIFILFQGFVLADIAPNDPPRLAGFALGYWVFTLFGMWLFGAERWGRQVECFTVLFSLIGSLRPVHLWPQSQAGAPGWFSIRSAPLDTSRAVFCLIILASGSFDGLHETFWWLAKLGINPLEFPGRSAVVWPSTLGLIAANLALIGVFALSLWVGLKALAVFGSTSEILFSQAFNTFAISILPIALGYHFSHYLVSFMVQIQYVLIALGDPFGRGMTLFGLSDLRVTTGFLNTADTVKVIWLTQAFAVVFSHVVSVLMAHQLASGFCRSNRDMLLLQVGLSVLMIFYTIFGLWLLAAPRGA
ncbi:hypothetical protein [Sulfitobacter sp. JB4-11]|uniref:hypothetical protein n=1 Tax=Sulfitobacter rhodophyticola TaxID=3238304 RepID=UPI003D8196AB